jgi:hypothetical protein
MQRHTKIVASSAAGQEPMELWDTSCGERLYLSS